MDRIRSSLNRISDGLIIVVTCIIIVATVLDGIYLMMNLYHFAFSPEENFVKEFSLFLGSALNLVIGLEFVKMLIHHSPDLVIEILIYAISRGLVVSHPDNFNILLGVLSIAILFGIRRYLLLRGVDLSPENASPEAIHEAAIRKLEAMRKFKESMQTPKGAHKKNCLKKDATKEE